MAEGGIEMVRGVKSGPMRTECSGWDPEWIEEGLQKRRSNFSNIICFETKDPQRYKQLLEYLPKCKYCEDSTFFLYNPWNGLMKGMFNSETKELEGVPYCRDVGEKAGYPAATAPEEVINLAEALKVMDKFLKSRKTAFLMRHVEGHTDQENVILRDAFRDWALDKHIMDKGSLIVLLTSDLSSVLDESTSSLIALITPVLSKEKERREIIQYVGQRLVTDLSKEDLESLILATSGLNLHQVKCVLLESYHKHNEFRRQEIKKLKAEFIHRTDLVEVSEHKDIICQECQYENSPSETMCKKCGQDLKQRRGFASLGGYDKVKEFTENYILKALKDPKIFEDLELKPPRGILLFGPPGTGKSTFASALAEVAHVPFINLRTENLYSPWIGVSGQRFRDAIHLVEQMSPAICFIDEIDRFGMRTGGEFGSGGGGEELRRVFNQVLEWLGNKERKAIIVGATNRPQDLDEAFKRPGRIDYKIPFLYPDKDARKEILKVHLGKPNLDPALDDALDDLLEELSWKTPCFTGAEIEQLVLRAKRRAVQDGRSYLKREDFERALRSFRIDWEGKGGEDEFEFDRGLLDRRQHHPKGRIKQLEFYIKQAEEECDDQELLEELIPEELKAFLKEAKARLEKGRGFSLEEAIAEGLPLF